MMYRSLVCLVSAAVVEATTLRAGSALRAHSRAHAHTWTVSRLAAAEILHLCQLGVRLGMDPG